MNKGIALLFGTFLFLGACRGKDKDIPPPPDDATILYNKTLQLISQYSDSLSNAPDSMVIMEVMTHFNEKLDSLNFSVPPDTDLKISEGENDTLYLSIEKIRLLYDERLKRMAGRETENEADTCQQSTTL